MLFLVVLLLDHPKELEVLHYLLLFQGVEGVLILFVVRVEVAVVNRELANPKLGLYLGDDLDDALVQVVLHALCMQSTQDFLGNPVELFGFKLLWALVQVLFEEASLFSGQSPKHAFSQDLLLPLMIVVLLVIFEVFPRVFHHYNLFAPLLAPV